MGRWKNQVMRSGGEYLRDRSLSSFVTPSPVVSQSTRFWRPLGLVRRCITAHGWRRGLHSCAPLRGWVGGGASLRWTGESPVPTWAVQMRFNVGRADRFNLGCADRFNLGCAGRFTCGRGLGGRFRWTSPEGPGIPGLRRKLGRRGPCLNGR